MATDEAVIEVHGLTKAFYPKGLCKVVALDHVDLRVARGELTALVGPDGAGKTTLMRLVTGLMAPTAGTLTVVGYDVRQQAQAVQDRLSYMPQKFGLYEDLTVQENMNLYADLHGVPRAERTGRFNHLLSMMGLERFTGRLAGKLSGGMKQKLGLACTLVRSPDLLLLDEPTVGVDPLSRRELWTVLQQLVGEEHLSVFVSTAYMDEAARCQQVYVLNQGRMLAHDTPAGLTRRAQGLCYRVAPPKGVATRVLQSALLDDPAVQDAVPVGGQVHFITSVPDGRVGLLTRHGLTAQPAEARLEDAFMLLLHADQNGAANGRGETTLRGKAVGEDASNTSAAAALRCLLGKGTRSIVRCGMWSRSLAISRRWRILPFRCTAVRCLACLVRMARARRRRFACFAACCPRRAVSSAWQASTCARHARRPVRISAMWRRNFL